MTTLTADTRSDIVIEDVGYRRQGHPFFPSCLWQSAARSGSQVCAANAATSAEPAQSAMPSSGWMRIVRRRCRPGEEGRGHSGDTPNV
jgi:hypothetical protein